MKLARATAVTCAATILLLLAAMLAGCGGTSSTTGLKNPSNKATPAMTEAQKLTPEQLLFEDTISGISVSPDGSKVAWAKVTYTPESATPVVSFFVTRTADLSTVQLTSGMSLASPRWSPDSSTIAFMSSEPIPGAPESAAGLQIWLVPGAGGAPTPLTQVPGGVGAFDWKGAGNIVFTAPDVAKSKPAEQPVSAADDTIHVSDTTNAVFNLYQVSAKGGAPTTVFNGNDVITHLTVSPDGRYAFIVRTKDKNGAFGAEYYQDVPYTNHIIDLSTGADRKVLPSVRQVPGGCWSQDSKTFYTVEDYNPGRYLEASVARLWALNPSTGAASLVDLNWGPGLAEGGNLRATPDGFAALLASGFNPKVATYARSGSTWKQTLATGQQQGNIFSFDVSADAKTIAYFYSTASKPPQAYVASLSGGSISSPRQFTSINGQLAGKSFAVSETFTWTGANGDKVEGQLFYPAGYTPGKKYPLVVSIHGGPFGNEDDQWISAYRRWTDPRQLFAQKGAFVLVPNFHGSSGYGLTFADSLKNGNFYALQMKDIETGIERLLSLGMIDENKLGTMGWSNGGMITNGLIASDQRFKAASAGAGGAEWVSLWGPCQYGDAAVVYYFGADPVADPDLFKNPKQDPFYNAPQVKTPVIMFGATEDVAVPVGMSWITYRGIQKYAKTPVQFYLFPGEPHVLVQPSHQLRKIVQEQAWFDKYLFGKK
jgi:dipeptidyl aminopeptidase/acylaminoacyl peptidase